MISSEVQRTLVKSAPELWAELSDPAALARHLGELGEIRITRIDPEQRLEWEACEGDISGTVVIKPSGWGTKVKLTVKREIAEPAAPIETGAEAGVEAEPAAEAAAEPEPDTGAEAKPEVVAEDDPNGMTHRPHAAPAVAAAPADAREPEPLAAVEPQPQSSLEAGEPSPGQRQARKDAAPEMLADIAPTGLDEELSHARASAPAEALIEADGDFEPEDGPEAEQAGAHEPEREPDRDPNLEPEPARRGFFARLFGLRRTQQPQAEAPPDLLTAAQPEDEHRPDAGDPDDGTPDETITPAHGPIEADAAWARWGEPSEPDTPMSVESAPAAVSEPAVDLGEAETHAGMPPAVVDSESGPGIHAIAEQRQAPGASATDIAAEIRAAEQGATEEVTAVLTGVLDRLGAAHHRPFSRA